MSLEAFPFVDQAVKAGFFSLSCLHLERILILENIQVIHSDNYLICTLFPISMGIFTRGPNAALGPFKIRKPRKLKVPICHMYQQRSVQPY